MCNCKKIPIVTPTSVTVAEGVTTLAMPSNFISTPGCVYDISLNVPIPAGTDGTAIKIGSAPLLNKLGSNIRLADINSQQIFRVLYLNDPVHFILIGRRWRKV